VPERYLGQHLGRFRIDTVVGSGGFAWVYKGYDPELEIPVAIKVLKPQFAGEEAFETRFRREASTAAKLRHPNIIRILAVGREGAAVYFVMDYLPHGLEERLRIMGTLPESLLIRLGMDVSAALAFAHREGVIHRDIKIDNILFDEHGNAVVADFGIARAVSGYTEQTGTNMVVGTPQYFSPEQARGQSLDGRADIYSLGVTLFKSATGVLPFQGEDWYEIARQHVEDPPPRPRSFNPALSRDMDRVILKCLAKDPNDRYPTGDALHTELVQLLGKSAIASSERTVLMATPARNAPIAYPRAHGGSVPWWRRRRAIMTWAASLVILMFGLSSLRGGSRSTARVDSDSIVAASSSAPRLDTSNAPTASARSTGAMPATVPGADSPTTSRPTAPRRRPVHILVPDDAVITLNGRVVGKGEWHTDSLPVGSYAVTATVETLGGCPTARDQGTLQVRGESPISLRLAPRACGMLLLDVLPVGARFSLSGTRDVAGILPVDSPLVLPEGHYVLRVSGTYCADFTGGLDIASAQQLRERVRLICQ